MDNFVEKERLNIYLPKRLVEELRRQVPSRERTQFIADVLERELKRKKLLNAIRESYGAWRAEDHPELATIEDMDRWLEETRSEWDKDYSENE